MAVVFGGTNISARSLISAHQTPAEKKRNQKDEIMKIKSSRYIVPFSRLKIYIISPSELMTITKRYGFVITGLEYYALPHTWILHTIVLIRYILVSILICFSI